MKKIVLITILGIFSAMMLNAAEPDFVETSLRYNSVTDRYEVYAKFDVDGPICLGMSLITVILPAEAADNMLVCQSYNGSAWLDLSRTYNEDGKDYHGLITSGQANIPYKANTEIKLFDFKIISEKPVKSVRLWDIRKDKNQTLDGTDYRSNFYFPKTGYYIVPQNATSTTVSVDDFENDSQFKVYPNPAVDKIHVVIPTNFDLSKGATFKMLNLEGKIIQSQFISSIQERTIDIEASNLQTACYIIQIDNGKETIESIISKISK